MQSLKYEHLIDLIFKQVNCHKDEIALENYKDTGRWKQITWRRFEVIVEHISQHLLQQGLSVGQNVAIFAQNSSQWTCADISVLAMRGVTVPIYPTSTQEQLLYILQNTEAEIIFVDTQENYDLICKTMTNGAHLKHVIVFDSSVILQSKDHIHLSKIIEKSSVTSPEYKERLSQKSLNDLATLIYTSGTTGNPKGVMLDHLTFASSISQHKPFVKIHKSQVSLSFLPLSHVFERSWTFYILASGGKNVYLNDPMQVQQAMKDVVPHYLCVVPRFLEKVYAGVHEKVSQSSFIKKKLFSWALGVADKKLPHKKNNFMSTMFYCLANKMVLRPIRTAIAPRLQLMPCGGAALDTTVARFFYHINMPVISGYGMTETTATITCQRLHQQTAGSCGTPLSGVHIKISDNNEILVKGDTVMRGYYKNLEATREVLHEGWLKTGDAGFIDIDGQLYITDRIKELMKTSNGKYIAPQRVEGLLSRSPFIDQIAIIADARNYVSALIVPAYGILEDWAKNHNIHYKNIMDLIKNTQVQLKIEQSIASLQHELARFEQVKKFTLLSKPFSVETGEVTPTLKLKRKVISQKYAHQISSMYH